MSDDSASAQPTPTDDRRMTGGGLRWLPPTPERLQEMLSGYEVTSILGQGGMAAVYKGRQQSLDRPVAIKILPPQTAEDDLHFAERFKNEARTMARMNHPAIVHVYDFGQTSEGQLYIVMEFIDGTDVAQMIRSQGRLPQDYALSITAHVCDALDYAHAQGIVHRDIKPANVMVNMEGQIKVADFGLAKATDASEMALTKTNLAMGTPDFVSPEALMPGVPLDGRADLYAVGVMLYNMLTGSIPRGAFRMPSHTLQTDARFDHIIGKAMEMDRENRYQTALDLRRDLDVILTMPTAQTGALQQEALPQPQPQEPEGGGTAGPQPRPSAEAAGRKASPAVVFGIPAALVGIAVCAFLFFGGGEKPAPAPPVVVAEGRPEPQTPVGQSAAPQPVQATVPQPAVPQAAQAATPQAAPPPAMAAAAPEKGVEAPAGAAPAPGSAQPGQVLTFGGHRYQFLAGPFSKSEGGERAASLGGHLLTITSAEEQAWIEATFGDLIGGNDALFCRVGGENFDKGIFSWRNGESWGYTNWDTGSNKTHGNWIYSKTASWGVVVLVRDGNKCPWRMTYFSRPCAIIVEWDDDGTAKPGVIAQPLIPAAPPPEALSFGDHRYLLVQEAVSWDTAKAKAEAMGGHLATITSKEENAWLLGNVKTPSKEDHIWIGGSRDPKNKAAPWKWVTGEPFDVSLYGNEGPDGSGPFLTLFLRRNGWDDVHTESRYFFLVEWDNEGFVTQQPPPDDPRLAQLAGGFKTRHDADALQPYTKALAALTQSYVANGIARARAAAKDKGALEEVTALDAEKENIEKGGGVPSVDSPETPAALQALRGTYRTARARLVVERQTRAVPVYAIYLKALDTYVAELTKADKIEQAQQVKRFRDSVAAEAEMVAPRPPPPPADAVAGASPPPPAEVKGSSWRAAAQWCLGAKGGLLEIGEGEEARKVDKAEDLPRGRFAISTLGFSGDPGPGIVTDATLSHLNGLRELSRFSSGMAEVSGPGLEVFRTTPKVTELTFNNAGLLKDEHLAPLGALKDLRILTISGTTFTGAVLQHLAGCRKLEQLDIPLTLTPQQAGTLQTLFPMLKSLRIFPGSLGKDVLGVVGQFKWLERLDFNGNTSVTDAMLAPLGGMTGLRELRFSGCTKMTGTGLDAFIGSGELRFLDFSYGQARASGAALPVIARMFPRLDALQITVGEATDEEIGALCAHPHLKSLKLYGMRVTDHWLAAIATLPGLRSLRFGSMGYTEVGVEHLLRCKNLQELSFDSGSNMSAPVITALKQFTKLKNLGLRGPTVSDAVAAELKKALPNCQVLVEK